MHSELVFAGMDIESARESYRLFDQREWDRCDFDALRDLKPKPGFNFYIKHDIEWGHLYTAIRVYREDDLWIGNPELVTKEPRKPPKVYSGHTVLTKPTKVKKERKGWCYLLSDGEYQKIGITTRDLAKRISQIQNGNPKKISVIAKYKVNTDVFYIEKKLHYLFKESRASGEWFLSNIEEDEFMSLCKDYDK